MNEVLEKITANIDTESSTFKWRLTRWEGHINQSHMGCLTNNIYEHFHFIGRPASESTTK